MGEVVTENDNNSELKKKNLFSIQNREKGNPCSAVCQCMICGIYQCKLKKQNGYSTSQTEG